MTEITGYRGSRFDTGGTRPLLHDTWQALDELAGQADVWLEVLAGAKYRRQLSELAKHAINNPDYVLQVVLRLPGTDTMVGDEYLDKAHRLLKDLPGGSFTTLREGSVTPPKYEGPFCAADEANNAWYIREPSCYTAEKRAGNRTLVLAGVASPLASGYRVYNSEDWVRHWQVKEARGGGIIFDIYDIIKNGVAVDKK